MSVVVYLSTINVQTRREEDFSVFLQDQPPHGPHGAWSVSWSAFNGTFSPNRQYCAIGVRNISRRAWGQERRIIRHAPALRRRQSVSDEKEAMREMSRGRWRHRCCL